MWVQDFILKDQDGEEHSLADYRGQWVVLYFYPKDDTPGCTLEACSFRDLYEKLLSANATVIGVSKDSVKSHKAFAQKHALPFVLLSDADKAVQQAYGATGRKKFMSREYEGALRKTFIISPDGEVVKTYENVTPLAHGLQVLNDLRTLQAAYASEPI